MADQHNIIYNIEVNTKDGTVKIDGITKGFEKASAAVKKLGIDTVESANKSSNAIAGTVNAIKSEISALRSEQNAVATNNKQWLEYQVKISGAEQRLRNLQKTQSKVALTTKNLTKATKEGKSATGASTSAALELGRVISDAPYGIRGMANNVSQLASQFSFMSNKVDETTGKVVGFNGAMKNIGKAIKANAALLAIQAVIATMDYFSTKVSEADRSLQKLATSGVNESITELTILKNRLQDASVPLEEKKDLIKGAREEYEEFNTAMHGTGDAVIPAINALQLLTDKMKDFAKARMLVELITDTMKQQAKVIASNNGDWTNMFNSFDTFLNVAKGTLTGAGFGAGLSEAFTQELNTLQGQIKKYEAWLGGKTNHDSTKTYWDLIYGSEGKGKGSKDKKVSPFKTPKELDIDIKNIDNAVLAYEKKTRDNRLKEELNNKLSQAKSEKERKLIRDAYAADRLESELKAEGDRLLLAKETEESIVKDKYNTHIAQLNNAKELYEFKIKNDPDIKNKEGLLKKLNSTHKASLKQAKDEFKISMSEIQSNFKLISVAFEDYSESRRNSLNSGDFGSEGDEEDPRTAELAKRLKKTEEFAEKFNAISSAVTSFMDGEFQRQITMEQNKTNAINNELRERLNNENLSAGERKNIQLQIARNDEALRKKQEKIEKKRFKMQKAANISQALVATYLSAQKAYLSQLQLDPTSPIRAKIAAGVATAIGLGNVAMIARQKFQSSAGATVPAGALGSGGGSGSGNGDRSFNFNLAGATRENQLAQTLQGRFDQPLQAYVVSRDITNQQQLDEDIRNNASFG